MKHLFVDFEVGWGNLRDNLIVLIGLRCRDMLLRMILLIKKEVINFVRTNPFMWMIYRTGMVEAVQVSTEVMAMFQVANRLHLKDKIATARVHLRWIEYTTVGFEPTTSLMPAATVESIEVVAPVELKLLLLLIILVNFDVIEEEVPWHVDGVEPSGPTMESRCPEVHPDRLSLVNVSNSLDAFSGQMTNFMIIDSEGDVVWRPLHRISVPVIVWVIVGRIVMVFVLIMTITVDHVGPQRICLDRGDDLNIELIPTSRKEVRPIPIGEEGGNGALAIRSLHSSHELSVSEFLVARYRAALPVGVGNPSHT